MKRKTNRYRKYKHNNQTRRNKQTRRNNNKHIDGGGLFRWAFKGANTFRADPIGYKGKGRMSDLSDFLVNLNSNKGEWRQLKRNLAKLSAYDLTVPADKQAYVNELITRLESRGVRIRSQQQPQQPQQVQQPTNMNKP